MPIFNNETELLERLRADARPPSFRLFSETSTQGLENIRYELVDGMVRFCTSLTRATATLKMNLTFDFYRTLEETDYFSYSHVDIKLDDGNFYTPAMLVTTERPSSKDHTDSPIVICDILTATNKYDLLGKFDRYKNLPSLQDYLLIDGQSQQVWHYQRTNDWQEVRHTEPFYVASLDLTADVARWYHDLVF